MIQKRARLKEGNGTSGEVLEVKEGRAKIYWGTTAPPRPTEPSERHERWHDAEELEFFDEVVPDPPTEENVDG